MRDENERARERVELSLDGRQIASIVVAALVVLGVVFVLGFDVGRKVARREAEAARGPADLSALDRAPVQAPARPEQFTYHDKLTSERPAPPPPAAPATAPAAPPAPAAAAAADGPSAQAEAAPQDAPAKRATFSVQVGSTPDRAEADRIAARFRGRAPRVEAADLGARGRWWRVRVGAFASRDDARRLLADLSRETGVKGLVASEP